MLLLPQANSLKLEEFNPFLSPIVLGLAALFGKLWRTQRFTGSDT